MLLQFLAYATFSIFADGASNVNHAFKMLEGEWIPETYESGGVNLMFPGIKVAPYPGLIEYRMIEIKDHDAKIHLRLLGKNITINAKIKIDILKTARYFEANLKKGVIVRGIFAIDRNIMLISVQTRPNQKAPVSFNSLSDPSVRVLILRKVEKTEKKRCRKRKGDGTRKNEERKDLPIDF